MKQFISKSIIFLLIMFVLLHAKPLYLLYTGNYKLTVAGSEIYVSLVKSKQKKKAKKLFLGDSVGNQIFPNTTDDEELTSLACNQAVSLAGQYVLLYNYLKSGNNVDTVYLFYHPVSFTNNLDQVYSFQYFIKPFYNDEYKMLFDETVKTQVEKIPYYYLAKHPYILTSNWAPPYTPAKPINYTFISPISAVYLQKMKNLGTQHHFRILIIPPPVSLARKKVIEAMDQSEIEKNHLSDEFGSYFKKIKYLPNNLFKDTTHLRRPENYVKSIIGPLKSHIKS